MRIMKKIKILSIICIICLMVNAIIPIVANKSYAQNNTTLDFKNGEIRNNKIYYNTSNVEVGLYKKSENVSKNYENINITEKDVQIDLNEYEYYLMIENPNNNKIRLMINGVAHTIPANNYFKLSSSEFSGVLNIEIENLGGQQAGQTKENVTVNAISTNGNIADVLINNIKFNDGMETSKINSTKEIDKKSQDEIQITVEFGKTISSIKINGVAMDITGVTDIAKYTVNHETLYNIEVVCGGLNKNINMPISWDYTGKKFGQDSLVQHGDVEILSVKLEDGTILTSKQMQEYVEEDRGFGMQKYPKYNDAYLEKTQTTGEVRIKPGLEVTIKLIPNYGYQLTSTSLNGTRIEAVNDKQSTFTFNMPATPLHLSALFTKVEDKVKTQSKKIQSGNIEITDNEIDTGSVILSVRDVELKQDKISNFKEAAKGYNISSYLDINLDQVIYKGTENDVWTNELRELNSPAKITLKLEEGVDGNEIVIVHEKHDGTYEIIPTTYDKEKNTIIFNTSSFSNYAIASKTISIEKSNENTLNPKTSDNIMKYCIVFTINLLVILMIPVVSNKIRREEL